MNPTRTSAQTNQNDSLFRSLEAMQEFENAEPENTSVTYSPEDKVSIKESWDSFYQLKSENITESVLESPISRIEIAETITVTEAPKNNFQPDLKPMFAVENAKGSGSILEETGLKLDFVGLGKEIGKGLFGAFSLFKEIFMDTVTAVVGKKEKKAKKQETDPKKAEAAAKKEATDRKKKNTIRAFYDRLLAQTTSVAPVEAVRAETQEKAQINLTAKIGQESYKGIKDSFGRLTKYAASMFEKAQMDQEKKIKKQEKEMKINSIGKNPDLNMDKAAEGGFLSSTGGQGAG